MTDRAFRVFSSYGSSGITLVLGLVGEAKWSEAAIDIRAGRDRLLLMAQNSAWARGREVVLVLWVKRGRRNPNVHMQTPDDVLEYLT